MGESSALKKGLREGILDEIENTLTSGYGKKEDLRALDKDLRDHYYSELMDIRHRWEKIYLNILESGQASLGRAFKDTIQTIDHLAMLINRADYGYAPLFDRVQKIERDSLLRVLEYDKNLSDSLHKLSIEVDNLKESMKVTTWPQVQTYVDAINVDLKAIEDGWRNRMTVMKSNMEKS